MEVELVLINWKFYLKNKFSPEDVKYMCSKGERVLFVRHPVLRLISAWNDKFSLANNNALHGLWYGMNLLRGSGFSIKIN